MKKFIIGLLVLGIGIAIGWYINKEGEGERERVEVIQRTAKVANECVNFSHFIGGASRLPPADRSPSMSLTRGENGCYVNLDEVKFYEKKDCPGPGKPGQVKKDIGNVVCSGLSGGCRECVLKTHNTPFIIEFWNGIEMVSYCYDFDGPPADCNLPLTDDCIHSAQCTSGNCSGGTCQVQ